jgi:hypothetical protein
LDQQVVIPASLRQMERVETESLDQQVVIPVLAEVLAGLEDCQLRIIDVGLHENNYDLSILKLYQKSIQ